MDSNVYALVMAGGKGTRLWPESTAKKPKQYLSLINDKSLLTQTLDRFDSLIDKENRFIVTTEDQRELALLIYKRSLFSFFKNSTTCLTF